MILDPLQGKYHVMKRIGAGGFATIYSGFDMSLERPVAIKLLKHVKGAGDINQRFLREARAMANLSHSNIAAVYDSAEHEGRPYMVMELVYGPTLMDLAKTSPPSLPQLCMIAKQICTGMKYGHDNGVIHGDLTLGNVMINDDGIEQQVKILDFGMAQFVDDDGSMTEQVIAGTAYHMAPEQIRDEPIDARTDIFSFGVCFHRMLNGFFPFEAEFPAAISYLILNEERIAFIDEVPEEIRQIVKRCLEKRPQDRYGDFGEVVADIDRVLDNGVGAESQSIPRMPGLAQYVGRQGNRNPYLNRVMISNPAEFFCRAREVRRIYSRLDAPRPQSISVVGDRRIGKSSLLYHIYDAKNRQREMNHHNETIFVYLDFQQNLEFDVPRFIDFLFNMFSYEGQLVDDYSHKERTLDELKNVVKHLQNQGKRIVVLMDEFEVITGNPKFEGQFFALLRALANTYNVAYVTTSNEDLQKMCHDKVISDSPFFNIFSNLLLRPFSKEEAVELVMTPSAMHGVPLERHADRIVEMAGLFPLFLQIACSAVFETLMGDPEAEPDWHRVHEVFLEEAKPHYRSIWDHLDESSKEALTDLVRGKAVSGKIYVKEDLVRRGYIIESDKRTSLCSTSFKDFVAEQTGKSGRPGILGSLLRKRT